MSKSKKFSIVIALAPERNAEVLRSLEKINYNKEGYEIIIERGRNPSDNRNNGAKKAAGEIIAFIDDDAIMHPEILNVAEKFFQTHKDIDVVGGPQLTPKDDSIFGKISGIAFSSKFGAWKISNRYAGKNLILNADETMLTSANLFCRKGVMDRIKFNPLLFPGEDPDFINRVRKAGLGIAYSPDLIVYHRRRNSLASLMKQIYSYGYTRPIKETLRETMKMPFFLIPSIFVVYLFCLLIFLFSNSVITGAVIGSSNGISTILFLPLLGYIILSLVFSVLNSIASKNIRTLLALPFIYLTIHLSYGLGFLISSIMTSFKFRK